MRKSLYILLFMLLAITPQVASAQQNSTPQIVSFETNLDAVTPDEAESGVKMAQLNWQIVGLQPSQEVMLQVWVLNEWHDALPENADLQASDSIVHAVPHTLSFAPPLFRLVVRTANGQLLTSHQLQIPYYEDPDIDQNPPQIVRFETSLDSVSEQALRSGTLQVPVSWEFVNRPVGANPVFEQVLPDGDVVSAELPRQEPWVQSSGNGIVNPIYTGERNIQMQLRLVNFETGVVYDMATFSLPVNREPANNSVSNPALEPPLVNVFAAEGSNQIRPGDTLTLVWNTENTTRVFIEYLTAEQMRSAQSYVSPSWSSGILPPSGTLNIEIPADISTDTLAVFLYTNTYDWHDRTLADGHLTIEVQDPLKLPILKSFTASANRIRPGDTLTLSWNVENATQVFIEYLSAEQMRSAQTYTSPSWSSGILPPSGTLNIEIPADISTDTLAVFLYADTYDWHDRTLADGHLTIEIEGGIDEAPSTAAVGDVCFADPYRPNSGITVGSVVEATIATHIFSPWLRGTPALVPSSTLAMLEVGERATVVDGPWCYQSDFVQNRAWQVRAFESTSNAITGWVFEYAITIGQPTTYLHLAPDAVSGPNNRTSISTQAAFQPYQQGFMIWRADTGTIYTLGAGVETYPQSSYEGLPNNDCTEGPPAGFVCPMSGFGRIWANHSHIRDYMGWATALEQSYQATIVTDGTQLVSITLPDGRTVFIDSGSSWRF